MKKNGTELKLPVSPAELVETIQKLKSLGVYSLRMEGLDFEIDPPGRRDDYYAPGAEDRRPMVPPSRDLGPECEVCGDEKMPSKWGRGFYCVACYKKSRDAGGGRRGRQYRN